MKKLYIIVIAGLLISITSCQKIDANRNDILTDDQVFGTDAGLQAYIAQEYRKLPIESFEYRPDGRNDGNGNVGFNLHHEWEHFYRAGAACGEMVGPYGGTGDISNGFGYWPYADIRAVNYFIETLPKYAKNYTADKVTNLLGEARFLRAYYYFALVKRYGGIPIITTVQSYPQQSIAELQVHRNTEADAWNFIGNELDTAYQMLPESMGAKERANKYVAMALKSRAMLYAGSIAKYGSQNYVDGDARSQGFVGISADQAPAFFKKQLMLLNYWKGIIHLYRGKTDKTDNYVNIFLDPASPENILIRSYFAGNPERCHSWDATYSPNSGLNYMSSGGLSRAYPTLELVERFDSLNMVTNSDGTPHRFDNLGDFAQGLEPRLRATIYFPGDVLRGQTFDTQEGIYPSFSGTAADEVAKPSGSRTYITSGDHKTLYNGRLGQWICWYVSTGCRK